MISFKKINKYNPFPNKIYQFSNFGHYKGKIYIKIIIKFP